MYLMHTTTNNYIKDHMHIMHTHNSKVIVNSKCMRDVCIHIKAATSSHGIQLKNSEPLEQWNTGTTIQSLAFCIVFALIIV